MELVKWERAKQAIAEVRTVDEIKSIRDRATAAALYAKQSGETIELQNAIVEVAIRAERRAGELLKEMEMDAGGRPTKNPSYDVRGFMPTLEDMGISYMQSSRWQKMAALPEERFEGCLGEARESGKVLTRASVYKLTENGTTHVSHNSCDNNEWYTPPEYIYSVIEVFGAAIDLDPASSHTANKIVGAQKYFTIQDDGLSQEWHGTIFLNPPYSAGLISRFVDKAIDEVYNQPEKEAIILVNNATETQWFQKLCKHCDAVCFPAGRIQYLSENGEARNSPIQGQAFFYLGLNTVGFTTVFSQHGAIFDRRAILLR